jgi:DNA helicase-2/ATP-dependent DNA helicase PcrA
MNLDELNDSQKKAVVFNGKHLLVIAGAGTGKTRTIIAHAAYLISIGVDPIKIQILTFTKRAASEIVTRVKASLDKNQAQNLHGSTFHSWCNQLLTYFPNLFGTNAFTIIDEDDQLSIMKMVCGKNALQFKDIKIKARSLLDIYSFGRNTRRNLTESLKIKLFYGNNADEQAKLIAEIGPRIETLLRGYENKKRERKYLDYDDILLVVATRLSKDENARNIVSGLYEHILVDEMQDTNPLQWDLLNPFQEKSHLFCVGDDAQSIYSFRGADFKNIHSFQERVIGAEVYRLEDNYRSTQEILDVSNWLLEKSPIQYKKKLRAIRGVGNKPEMINIRNSWEEAEYIADKVIKNYTSNGKSYIDHLVLSRGGYYTTTLQAEFIKRKIPFVVYGGRKFMESAHIKDLVSAMRIVNNKDDEIAWMRYLTFWEGIGEIKATQLFERLMALSHIESCILELKETKYTFNNQNIYLVLDKIYHHINNVQNAVHGAYELMQTRMAVNYKQDWEKKRKPDFAVLEELSKNYSTISEFITETLLDTTLNKSPVLMNSDIGKSKSDDHVVISTIHSAKGLEADTCFVLNVSPGAYPISRTMGNFDEMEEERRVLYVALTRAKNNLIITRDIHSIHANSLLLSDSKITDNEQEQYFLNGFPDGLCIQSTKATGIRKFVKDIDTPNELDLPMWVGSQVIFDINSLKKCRRR